LKTVVVVSADGEWSAVRAALPTIALRQQDPWESFETEIRGRAVTFLYGGWGKVSAAGSAQFVIDRLSPDLIVNLGTCGGLEGRIERGTIVLVDRTIIYDIVEQMTDGASATAHYSTELDLSWLPEILPSAVARGLLVSADWESGAIAWVAKLNKQRLVILRGVTDLVGMGGGEAYGDYELYLRRTGQTMRQLIDVLPKWLEALEPVFRGAAPQNPT
jgi:adenosylhomocysteine nucleosidase